MNFLFRGLGREKSPNTYSFASFLLDFTGLEVGFDCEKILNFGFCVLQCVENFSFKVHWPLRSFHKVDSQIWFLSTISCARAGPNLALGLQEGSLLFASAISGFPTFLRHFQNYGQIFPVICSIPSRVFLGRRWAKMGPNSSPSSPGVSRSHLREGHFWFSQLRTNPRWSLK